MQKFKKFAAKFKNHNSKAKLYYLYFEYNFQNFAI